MFHTYIIKQDSHIYVPYSRPNGWTDRAEIFCGHLGAVWGGYRLKKSKFFFLENFFVKNFLFKFFFPRATPGPSASYFWISLFKAHVYWLNLCKFQLYKNKIKCA